MGAGSACAPSAGDLPAGAVGRPDGHAIAPLDPPCDQGGTRRHHIGAELLVGDAAVAINHRDPVGEGLDRVADGRRHGHGRRSLICHRTGESTCGG